MDHQKNLHKLSQTIRQAEKVGSNSSLYSDTKKDKNFKQKKCKTKTKTKQVQHMLLKISQVLIILKTKFF